MPLALRLFVNDLSVHNTLQIVTWWQDFADSKCLDWQRLQGSISPPILNSHF